MQRPEFDRIRHELLAGGVAPRFVERTVLELEEHYADIAEDALAAGATPAAAARRAREALGREGAIVAAVLAQPELLGFERRWPRSARWLRALAYAAVMPFVPVVYCAHHGGTIARWGASVSLSIVLTSALLFLLQSTLA